LLGGLASAATARTAEDVVVVADTYVTASAPKASYTHSRTLVVGARPARVALLRFQLGAPGDAISGAGLRLYAERSPSGGKVVVHGLAAGWKDGVTYARAPKPGPILGAATVSAAGGWTTIRLATPAQDSGLLNLALTSSRPLTFHSRETGQRPTLALTRTPSPVIAAAGQIGCDPTSPSFNGGAGTDVECGMRRTGDLLAGMQPSLAAVLALGDNQYPCGAYSDFMAAFDPAWGRVKSLIHPVMGNHDFACDFSNTGPGYFQYFGAAAGTPGQGWYSFDVGRWHVIALNSECSAVGGCEATSPQGHWLQADLAAHPAKCTLAFWHYPRFASGVEGNQAPVAPFWDLLYTAGVDIILNAHEHDYERFAPQNPAGQVDPARGIREFVVGTGGRMLHGFTFDGANSEFRSNASWGVLKLTLRPTSYAWQFVPVTAGAVVDAGSGACH
jgi:hypothetical protein